MGGGGALLDDDDLRGEEKSALLFGEVVLIGFVAAGGAVQSIAVWRVGNVFFRGEADIKLYFYENDRIGESLVMLLRSADDDLKSQDPPPPPDLHEDIVIKTTTTTGPIIVGAFVEIEEPPMVVSIFRFGHSFGRWRYSTSKSASEMMHE